MVFFDKIKAGLTKTRDALSDTLGSVFSGFSEIDDDFYDELEESLILADLGVDTSVKAADRLRKTVKERHLKTTDEAKEALKEILVDMLNVGDTALNLSTTPSVVLVIGVNGVGKTTTIGKIATQLKKQGLRLRPGEQWRYRSALPKFPTGPLRQPGTYRRLPTGRSCPAFSVGWRSYRWWWSCLRH